MRQHISEQLRMANEEVPIADDKRGVQSDRMAGIQALTESSTGASVAQISIVQSGPSDCENAAPRVQSQDMPPPPPPPPQPSKTFSSPGSVFMQVISVPQSAIIIYPSRKMCTGKTTTIMCVAMWWCACAHTRVYALARLRLNFVLCRCTIVCFRCPQSPREHDLSQQLAEKEATIEHLKRRLSLLASKVVDSIPPHVRATSGGGGKGRGSLQVSTYDESSSPVRVLKCLLIVQDRISGRGRCLTL